LLKIAASGSAYHPSKIGFPERWVAALERPRDWSDFASAAALALNWANAFIPISKTSAFAVREGAMTNQSYG
jgi:hypothetical protein